MVSASYIRSARIRDLYRMALNGDTLEMINHRALQMANKATAKEYVDEVLRRVQKLKGKLKQER